MSGLSSWALWMRRVMEQRVNTGGPWRVYNPIINQAYSLLPLLMLFCYLAAFYGFVFHGIGSGSDEMTRLDSIDFTHNRLLGIYVEKHEFWGLQSASNRGRHVTLKVTFSSSQHSKPSCFVTHQVLSFCCFFVEIVFSIFFQPLLVLMLCYL